MLLTLYNQYGSVKATLSPNDTSTQDKEIQGDNVLSLSFTLYEYVNIDVNDYVDFEGERYWAVEKYLPNEKSTVEWEYNVKLYGIESLIKRFLVLMTVDGGNEAVFTLTARPIEHMRLIVQNINDGMDHTTNFKVGTVEGTDNVVIDYTGKYCDEGLKELAEKVGVEWWIEGETVNLCRCEHGEEVTLGYGNGLTSLDRDVSDNAKFYTRLFPIGSSRNIDPDRYGSSRLQLPGGVKYVDVNSERYGIIHHYEQEAFSGIYPRRVGVVSSVRSENVTDTDGNPFTIYYFKDNDIPFDPNDYEIGGLVKHVSFQEGSELAGLGVDNDHYFEVNYNSETREFEIITIWPYDDDTQLPGGTLVPKAGDRYILWNIRMPDEYYGLAESEFLGAVNEYNQKHALDVSCYKAPTDHVWIEDEGVDLYIGRRVRLESQEYFLDTGYRASRITRISRQVSLPSQMDLEISDALSTRTLDKIDDAITAVKNYTDTLVGSMNVPDIIRSGDTTRPTDNNLYSARRSHQEFLSKKKADVAEGLITFEEGLVSNGNATFNGDVEIGDAQGSDNPTLTAHGDTEFNGNNVFNGRVTVDNTLDAQGDTELTGALETRQGTIEGYARLITRMLLGNYNGDFERLNADGGFLDKDGNAELENLLVRSMARITEGVFRDMTSANPAFPNSLPMFFEDGFGGHGMRMWHDDTKGWCMTLDTLRVRQTMYIYELVIQKIRAVGGILLVSAADGKIDKVQTVYVGINNVPHYLITFEDRNMFVEHDLMRCQKWSGKNYLGGDVDFDETHYDPSSSVHDTSETMKYYWVEVDYTMTSTNIPTIVTADDVGVTLGEKDILVRCDRFDDTIADPDTGEVYSVGVEPASGDECVLMGNTDSVNNKARQNYIMISAAEDGVPRIDIKTGCNSVGNTGNLRTRVGCLDGIFDSYWPIDGQPNGYGLYSDNAWLKGKFIVKINNQDKDVGTQFEVLDGMVRSTVEATRQDLIGEEGHISNNMFFNRYDKWWLYDGGEIYVISSDGTETTLNDSTGMLVSTGGAEYARLVEDDTVGYCDVLEIKASSYNTRKGIVQKNADFRNLPIFETDETTQEIVKQNFMLTFYYYAFTSSTVYTDLNGDVETTSLSATTDNRYHKVSIPYKWDGEGDFAIYGFGHFRIYGIVLTGNVDESMLDHYVTQIQQTARDITMSASAQVWNEETQQYDTVYFSQFYQTYNQFRFDIEDRFSQTESTINQTADNITMSVTEKIADSGNKYLNNASFNGWDKWTRNNTTAITSEVLNGRVILDMDAAQGQALTITQANADFKEKPTLFNDGNTPQPYPVVAEFYLEMVTSAIVLVSLGGVNMGTISTDETGRGFLRYKFSKGWDATGDFVITVRNGHVRIHSLMLNADTDAVTRSMISISSSQILAQVETEYVPVEGFGNRVKGVSGLVISGENGNFATLFAEAVEDEDYNIAKVSTSVQYNPTTQRITSNVLISADKINLEGYTTINDGFRVDEQGNATMNNATIVGVLNNLIQEKEFKDGNLRWDFNPLKYGSVIEWTPNPEHAHDTHSLYLPCAYTTDGTMIIDSSAGLTMRDLRQCVGKKYTFLCKTNDVSANMRVIGAVLIQREDYIGASTLDLSSMSLGTEVTPEHKYTRREWIGVANYGGITGNYYFTAECKMGRYSGYECIYWEVYCSAQRGEVTYKVSGTAKVNNTPLKHMEVVFGRLISASSEGQQYKTRTDNEGKYAIYLQGSELGVEYTMKVYTSDSASTPSTGTVTNENGTAYGSNATFSNIIPVEQQDITANINITT